MDEEDRRSIDLAPFAHMQLHATSADYGMNFHLVLHSLIPASMISRPTLEQVLLRALKKSSRSVNEH
jgi:hypothetical protein